MGSLAIIAGGGELPLAVAEAATNAGRTVFIVALRDSADADVARFPHEWFTFGDVGRMFGFLRDNDCEEVLLAGRVARPQFSELKLDAKAALLLPRIVAAARRGDDALLRALVDILESEGFHAVGAAEAAPGLVVRAGVLGCVVPAPGSRSDMEIGIGVVRRLGALDVGQAAIVCDGLVLAVEAAEGTDAMIARAGALPEDIRGTRARPKGVLVKAPKPTQDRKTDLPVIGLRTVKNAIDAGLAGIAVEAEGTLMVNRRRATECADAAGLFVVGFGPTDGEG